MKETISNFVGNEVAKRWSLVRTAALVTARPSAFADQMPDAERDGLWPSFRFFLKAVGIVIAVEAVFSFVFNTAFSDLLHHAFPILVALTGGVAVYALLKVLFTRAATFKGTVSSSLYVGGAALIMMVTTIFGLLTADFAANYDSVMGSTCAHRTIMCLVSGNRQYTYDALAEGLSNETQGWSYGPILLLILFCIFYFTHVLSTVLKRRFGVSRWRTYVSALVSVLFLSPAYLILLNAIYRGLYGATG